MRTVVCYCNQDGIEIGQELWDEDLLLEDPHIWRTRIWERIARGETYSTRYRVIAIAAYATAHIGNADPEMVRKLEVQQIVTLH